MARGRRRRTVLPVACWLGVAACSLDFDRYDPDAGTVPGADGGRDGSTDGVAQETATGDAPGDDGMPESSVNPCTAAAGTLDAPQAAGTITIDGDLGDW